MEKPQKDPIRVYCCFKKIKKCSTRLEKKDRKIKIIQSDIRELFEAYTGDDCHLFEDADVMCNAHYAKVRNTSPYFQQLKHGGSEPTGVPDLPKELRSGKILHALPHVQALKQSEVVQGPSHEEFVHPNADLINHKYPELYQPCIESMNSQGTTISFELDFPHLEVSMEGFQPSQTSALHSMVSQMTYTGTTMSQDPQAQLSQQFSINNTENTESQCSIVSNTESNNSSASSFLDFRYIQSTTTTDSKCFICNATDGRKSVPWTAVRQVWLKLNYFVPKTNRICVHHLDKDRKQIFTPEALQLIEATKQGIHAKSLDFGRWLHEVSDFKMKSMYSFELDGIEAERYHLWTGLKKEDFDDLATNLAGFDIRNTTSRSIRNALAMFLILMRTNLKQTAIGDMFGTSQQVVSSAIDTVTCILDQDFRTSNTGYLHMTHDEAVQKHSRNLTSGILNQPEHRLCIIADATYNYIETPSDQEQQRKTYSMHKHRNLYKFLYLVFPSGYILEVAGPYYCDAKNNDAANIREHYKNSDLLLFLEEDDFVLFDRGYRDVVEETEAERLKVFMPSLLDKKTKQFTCEEANHSRKVTLGRRVVESVFGRMKNVFPWFKHTIEGGYGAPKIHRFNRICAAIINKYFPALYENEDFHDLIIEVASTTANDNAFKKEVESLGLVRMTTKWEKADGTSVPEFPKMSWDDLRRFTLGSYQLKMANRYIKQHLKRNTNFGIFIQREGAGIIRATISSRYQKLGTHNCFVKYASDEDGFEAIKGAYCTCKVGERTLGTCSHLASVVRYLGYDRHQTGPIRKRSVQPWGVIDCSDMQEDEEEDEA